MLEFAKYFQNKEILVEYRKHRNRKLIAYDFDEITLAVKILHKPKERKEKTTNN